MNCERCNVPIPNTRNKGARFCSDKCRQAGYRAENFPYRGKFQTDCNKASTGTISEMLVCAELLKRGYSVFRSVSPAACCDLILLDGNGGMIRVEVKTAYKLKTGTIQCALPKHQQGKHDVLAMVFLADNSILFRPEVNSVPIK